METNQAKTVSKSQRRGPTSRKTATHTPRASAAAKQRAATGGKKRPAKAAARRPARRAAETLSAEQRAKRIAVAAYFLAERRGFAPDHELDDWLAAERSL